MNQILLFLLCWGLAFGSLWTALFLLAFYCSAIGSDLELKSWGKEAALAGFASLFQGAGIWVVAAVLHGGTRLLLVPCIIVGLLYKLGHLTDWGRYEVGGLLLLQVGLLAIGSSVYLGRYHVAVLVALVIAGVLWLVASLSRDL